jgi:hypothetical protein
VTTFVQHDASGVIVGVMTVYRPTGEAVPNPSPSTMVAVPASMDIPVGTRVDMTPGKSGLDRLIFPTEAEIAARVDALRVAAEARAADDAFLVAVDDKTRRGQPLTPAERDRLDVVKARRA